MLHYSDEIEDYIVVRKKGKEYFENTFVKKFDGITTIGLLLTLVMIFSFQGNIILEDPLHIVLIAIPLILQTFLIFAMQYWDVSPDASWGSH
jgi:ACR3 family arsenite transporter